MQVSVADLPLFDLTSSAGDTPRTTESVLEVAIACTRVSRPDMDTNTSMIMEAKANRLSIAMMLLTGDGSFPTEDEDESSSSDEVNEDEDDTIEQRCVCYRVHIPQPWDKAT